MTNHLRQNQVSDRPEGFVRARKRNRDKGYALVLLCCVWFSKVFQGQLLFKGIRTVYWTIENLCVCACVTVIRDTEHYVRGILWLNMRLAYHWFYMFCICPNAGAHDSKLLFDPLYINYKAKTYDKTERKEKKPKTKKKKNFADLMQ